MKKEIKRTWGKSTMYYCPTTKLVWQIDNNNKLWKYTDMPTYGLERKELPR